MPYEESYQEAVLVLPRLQVQNANAISSPMTWGFPAITAFIGMMHALARRLPSDNLLDFRGVGVICHDYEAQVSHGGYTRDFCLTRNPVDKDGSTAAIVEEGRVHLDITLVFFVNLATSQCAETARQQLAAKISTEVSGMRVAGGSVRPPLPTDLRQVASPYLRLLPDDDEDRREDFRRMCRRWLPGFALVSRHDLLNSRLEHLRQDAAEATVLDAWLDLSRRNHRSTRTIKVDGNTGEESAAIKWVTERRNGWTVPIPVGYAGLTDLHDPGIVANARDTTTSFRFVETVWSMGEWVSPHRLEDLADMLWYPHYDDSLRLYRCQNDYQYKGLT